MIKAIKSNYLIFNCMGRMKHPVIQSCKIVNKGIKLSVPQFQRMKKITTRKWKT